MKAVVVGALGLTLVNCGSHTAGPVEIVYWTGWSSNELDSQQGLIDEFNRAHPGIHVRLVGQYGDSGYEKVRIAFAGNSTPDVMSTVWADELASYAERGVLEPLDDYMKASGRDLDREFVPSLRKTLRVDGKVYGLAVTTNTQFIVYNRDLVPGGGSARGDAGTNILRLHSGGEKLGSGPRSLYFARDDNSIGMAVGVPRTADELRALSQATTVIRPDGSFVHYGYLPSDLRTWAYVFGGQWYDAKTNQITANDPHNVEALRWMASFSQFIDPMRAQSFQAGFGSDYSSSGPFFVGKLAMWQTGEWAGMFLKKYAPDIKYSFFPLPRPTLDGKAVSYANGSVFVIPKACHHKKEAWEFLNWLTQPAQVKAFCTKIHNMPALLTVGNAPEFQQEPLTRFAAGVSQSPEAVGPPGIAIWPTYSAEITRAEDAVMKGGKDPQQVLDDLQKRMSHEYAESLEELRR